MTDRICRREGCRAKRSRRATGGLQQCCSQSCNYVRTEMFRLEHLARAAGNDPAAAEMWSAAVEWNDSLTRLQDACRQLLANLKDKP